MIKPGLVSLFISAAALTFSPLPAFSQGFSTLKAAGEGVSSDKGDEKGGDGKKGSSASSKKSGGKSGSSSKAGTGDYLFIGVFETYVPTKRANARMSIFADPAEFKYADRTCKRMRQVRDRINTQLFKNPPKLDSRGRVEPEGVDRGVRQAIKRAMKTKREYFNTIYVVNGRFSYKNLPPELKGKKVSDCAAVIAKAKELEKGK